MASTLVGVTRQAETLQGYQLTEPVDMLTALQYISSTITAYAYSGTINCQKVEGGGVTWQLLVNNLSSNNSMFAKIGDWIILENDAIVTVCPAANFATLYQTV